MFNVTSVRRQPAKRGHGFARNLDIRVVRHWLNLFASSRIADIGDDLDHLRTYFGVVAFQIAVKLRQLSVEFAEFEQIDMDLIVLTAVERVGKLIDVIVLPRGGKCERERIAD